MERTRSNRDRGSRARAEIDTFDTDGWPLVRELGDLVTLEIAKIRGGTNPNCDAKFDGFFFARKIEFHGARFTMPGELRPKRLVILRNCCMTFFEPLRHAWIRPQESCERSP